MARKCLLCISVCAILVLSSCLGILTTQDRYLYQADVSPHRTESHISIELLDSSPSHHLERRQATNLQHPQEQSDVANNKSNQQFYYTTTFPSATTTKIPEIDNKSPLSVPNNSSVTKKALGKNLGENGAGIRKNYTVATPVPPAQTAVNESSTTRNETEEDDDISISQFTDTDSLENFNKTLEENNITETKMDTHIYYNSSFIVDSSAAMHYWVDMENNKSEVKINELLSKSHRRAATIKLSFDFPFYGHIIRNVTIATGGFLYMGDYVHSWLAATQYIAPLMANFDTSLSNDSYIKYIDNGTAFTVQWERVSLQDKPDDGEFTFQATLLDKGDIIFVYKTIPLIVEDIRDDHHPVKVGLSDAYIIDRTIFFVRRKTIYEYHRVNFNKEDIRNWTVIYLKALPTCLDSKDCTTCLTTTVPNFQCTWCPSINRCSNGLDRHRQHWLMKGCDKKQLINESKCSQANNFDNYDHSDGHEFYYGPHRNFDVPDLDHPFNDPSQLNHTLEEPLINETVNNPTQNVPAVNGRTRHVDSIVGDGSNRQNAFGDTVQASRISHSSVLDRNGDVRMGASGILTILFMVAVVGGLSIWVLYAYRNPHTASGQILIRYRPSQWSWKRGEARYTAATIHM